MGIIAGFLLAAGFLSDCEKGGGDDDDAGAHCGSDATVTRLPGEPVEPPQAPDCDGWRPPFLILGACMVLPALWVIQTRKRHPSPGAKAGVCCGGNADAAAEADDAEECQ